jgi:hypothetical protein
MRYLVVVEEGPMSFGAYVPDLPGCVAAAYALSVRRTTRTYANLFIAVVVKTGC